MHADEADAALHLRVELREAVVLERRMSATAVGIDEDAVRLREFFGGTATRR